MVLVSMVLVSMVPLRWAFTTNSCLKIFLQFVSSGKCLSLQKEIEDLATMNLEYCAQGGAQVGLIFCFIILCKTREAKFHFLGSQEFLFVLKQKHFQNMLRFGKQRTLICQRCNFSLSCPLNNFFSFLLTSTLEMALEWTSHCQWNSRSTLHWRVGQTSVRIHWNLY